MGQRVQSVDAEDEPSLLWSPTYLNLGHILPQQTEPTIYMHFEKGPFKDYNLKEK